MMASPGDFESALKVGFIGFGALGDQVSRMVIEQRSPQEIFVFDDGKAGGMQNAFALEAYREDRFADLEFYVCLGYRHLGIKVRIINELEERGYRCPALIHPSTYVNPSARIGSGTMIYPLCNVDKEVYLGRGVLLNNTVTISHNCTIGDGCYLSPGVTVSGHVDIGPECFVGTSAALANDIRIAARTTIGIATAVTRDIESPGRSVIGNPMRVLDHPLSIQ